MRPKMFAGHPDDSAKNETGDFARFTDFMKRLVAVPHSEIKARLEAEKKRKRTRSRRRSSASRASSEKD
jgi:hypothetical protein